MTEPFIHGVEEGDGNGGCGCEGAETQDAEEIFGGSVSFEEGEAIDDVIRQMYSSDLMFGWGIHVLSLILPWTKC